MANLSQRRLLLSLRQPFHLYNQFNSSIHRSISHKTQIINPNFRSSSFSSSSVLPKLLSPFNSSQLIQTLSFKKRFIGVRSFATRLSESSSNSSRPPKDAVMLEGCDFEHWLVVVEPPDPQLTRDDIIDSYIKTFAQIIGSEEEARMKIYSVSTRHYFAFSAIMSEELSYKLKELPNVRWVLPDSYMDVKNKTYAGEPFINGQAVPYDPKYHETWVRNNEESLRNNNKGRRRQRDPNSQSRSPASTHRSSNQNLISAYESQPNNAPHTPGFQNQTPQPSTSSDRYSHQQNWRRPEESLNQVPQSSRTPNPSRMQNEAQNQDPPTFSQNQAPKPPHMQNHSMARTSSPPHPPTTSTNFQGQGGHNYNWEPPRAFKNQVRHPSHMQNQTPSLPPTSIPTQNIQNNDWGATTMYQSQPPQPHISSNFQYNNMPPSAPSGNVPYQGQSRVAASGYQSQSLQPPIPNNFSHVSVPPSASASDPARNVPTHMQSTNFNRGSMPSQLQQDGHPYRNMPHHAQSGGFSNGYPSQSLQQQQYQGSKSSYSDVQRSNFVVTPNTQNFQNSPRWDVPVDAPQNRYPSQSLQQQQHHHQDSNSGYSDVQSSNFVVTPNAQNFQNSPRWEVPVEAPQNSYPSQSFQQQQYRGSNLAYNDVQSSNFVVTPPNTQNFQNSPRWDVPAEAQQNSYSRNISHQNGRAHIGYPSEPPHPSQYQQYQNNSRNLQNSNSPASAQGWNYQNMNPSMQTSISPNTPVSDGVQSHHFQGKYMPRPLQDREFQHNMEPTAQNVDFNGGRMPNGERKENLQTRDYQERDVPCVETVQARDYQERDIPTDNYLYASK